MIGLDIKEIRLKNGLSQTEFAESLDVSLRTVQNWESKKNDVSKKIKLVGIWVKNRIIRNKGFKTNLEI